jgi:hypothetical protein
MPGMGMRRFDRVHLSKWIDLIAMVMAIGFVLPALDLRNAGVNAAGGEGDDANDAAVVEACAARAAESQGDGGSGVLLLELRVMGSVEGKGGVEGNGALQKRTRTDE